MPRLHVLLLPFLLVPAAAPAAELETLFPPRDGLAPLVAAGPAERYTPDTLWERINGEAELYRRFRVRRAAFRRYELPGDPDVTLEAAVYLHDSALDAFGIYAFSRPEGGTPLPSGNEAAAEGYQAFMRHGAHFVTVTAFADEPLRARLQREALRLLAEAMGPAPAEVPVLEAVRRIPGAADIRYLPDHLLGRKVFPPGLEFTAGGKTYFLATAPVDGEKTLAATAALLASPREVRKGEARLLSGEGGSLGKITLALEGTRLAGVRSLARSEDARAALLRLLRIGPQ